MKKDRDQLAGQMTAVLEQARDVAAKAEGESRDLTADERTQIKGWVEQARDLKTQILEVDGDAALRDELNVLGAPVGELAKTATALRGRGKTVGEKFTEAPEFAAWMKSVAPTGQIPETAKGIHSPAVAFRGMKDILSGGVTDGDGAAGALVERQWLGLLDGLAQFQRPLTLRDLITVGQTTSDQVAYARVVGFTNNAAAVAEARGASTYVEAEGNVRGNKPESSMELEQVTANVKTIAHWLPATKRALSDAAQIRTLIDQFLRYGLAEELEDQIMAGNDAGENFEGILNVSGIQEQSFDGDILRTSRKAKTLVRTNGRAIATAYVLNPEDNERFDLMRDGSGGSDNSGAFLFGGPATNGVQTLWGLPRLESEAMPVGTGMVADWRMAVLWDREQAAIQVSDSHSDFFIRNLVAVLAELRAAFGVIRPPAFCAFELESGS